MPIVPCTGEFMRQAESLVRDVFRWMTPIERFSFIAIKRHESIAGRFLMLLAGVKDKIAFDVYLDDAKRVLGTTGLYRYNKDVDEAVWVSLVLCGSPGARAGRGPSTD